MSNPSLGKVEAYSINNVVVSETCQNFQNGALGCGGGGVNCISVRWGKKYLLLGRLRAANAERKSLVPAVHIHLSSLGPHSPQFQQSAGVIPLYSLWLWGYLLTWDMQGVQTTTEMLCMHTSYSLYCLHGIGSTSTTCLILSESNQWGEEMDEQSRKSIVEKQGVWFLHK